MKSYKEFRRNCPSGYKFDTKLGACVPKGNRHVSVVGRYLGGRQDNDDSNKKNGSNGNGNGNGSNGNGNGGYSNGGNGGGNGGGGNGGGGGGE